jgi:hypothetical protein
MDEKEMLSLILKKIDSLEKEVGSVNHTPTKS